MRGTFHCILVLLTYRSLLFRPFLYPDDDSDIDTDTIPLSAIEKQLTQEETGDT